MPMGIAKVHVKMIVKPVRAIVVNMRSLISSRTGFCAGVELQKYWNERPHLPWTRLPIHQK